MQGKFSPDTPQLHLGKLLLKTKEDVAAVENKHGPRYTIKPCPGHSVTKAILTDR